MKTSKASNRSVQHIAIIGAGMAGITAARTLAQAGHRVTAFEKSRGFGGRMSTRRTEFGSFDHGAQYFTVRDERFRALMKWALGNDVDIARPWGTNAVRVLDDQGRTLEAALPAREPHWVAQPGMNALVTHMAEPLAQGGHVHLSTQVHTLERGARGDWHLHTASENTHDKPGQDADRIYRGFDAVLLAIPSVQTWDLLLNSEQTTQIRCAQDALFAPISKVTVAPCWTLMLAFPNAMPSKPNMPVRPLGPQWNAARSTHHRIAWLARESSKPGRSMIERWTVQASSDWSLEHLEDDAERARAKLLKAFAEVTGIRAEPEYAQVHRWRYAKTQTPLGTSHIWDTKRRIGVCGDWCIGHRVEDAFVSGLELALSVLR
jgi:renalase